METSCLSDWLDWVTEKVVFGCLEIVSGVMLSVTGPLDGSTLEE